MERFEIDKLVKSLPPLLRERLEAAETPPPTIVDRQLSADGSRKYVLELSDARLAETVGIPHGNAKHPDRLTVCFSTQVGCAMGCAFCATARQGLTRNLTAEEMLWQAVLVGNDFDHRVDKFLAMGQGEPLNNLDALVEACDILGNERGFGASASNLMVSTCGILEGIHALADGDAKIALNISLHAARQALRDELMPGVKNASLELLHAELERYNELTGRCVFLQYLMLDGVNDSEADLQALQNFCTGLDAIVALLHFNRVEGIPFAPSTPLRMAYWALALKRQEIPVAINHTRGADIAAACGQLVNKVAEHEKG